MEFSSTQVRRTLTASRLYTNGFQRDVQSQIQTVSAPKQLHHYQSHYPSAQKSLMDHQLERSVWREEEGGFMKQVCIRMKMI